MSLLSLLLLLFFVSSSVCAFGRRHSSCYQPHVARPSANLALFAHPSESPSASSPPTKPQGPPFQLSHIDHVVIRCQNFPLMFDFYHRVLGCTIDEPRDGHVNRFGGALTHLRAGSCYIDLLAYDTNHLTEEGREAALRMHAGGAGLASKNLDDVKQYMSSETSTLDHLCLRIEPFNKQQLIDYLEEENVDIVQRSTAGDGRLGADGVGPSVYVRDPESNVIELKGSPYQEKNQNDTDFDTKNNQVAGKVIVDTDDKIQKTGGRYSENENEGFPSPSNDAQISTQKSSEPSNTVPRQTPCNRICRYNSSFYDGKVCIGCFREAYEIEMWQSSTSMEKAMTLLDAIDRLSNNIQSDGFTTEKVFDSAITKEELTQQYEYWSNLAEKR